MEKIIFTTQTSIVTLFSTRNEAQFTLVTVLAGTLGTGRKPFLSFTVEEVMRVGGEACPPTPEGSEPSHIHTGA